ALNFADLLECLEIEDNHLRRVTIANESAAKLRDQGNSVVTSQAADLADFDTVVCIHHYDFGSIRQVPPPPPRLGCDVVEILAAPSCRTERNFLEQVIAPCGRCR